MGNIKNDVAKGDGISDVAAFGFETKANALTYAGSRLFENDPDAIYKKELAPGESFDFDGNPWFVFWHTNQDLEHVLLMVAPCSGDLTLEIGSWGSQMLLKKQ